VSLSVEAITVLKDLNPWWDDPRHIRPTPPLYQRPGLRGLAHRLARPRALIEILRGPRQVGKTTGLYQIVRDLIGRGVPARDILFVRFDLELLRDERSALRNIVGWFGSEIRGRALDRQGPAFILLDEVHKLPRWDEEVKHLYDTFPVRLLLTGSSSVLVARGGRESLAGRVFTTELPPFSFREVLECWEPRVAETLPPRVAFDDVFEGGLRPFAEAFAELKPQQRLMLRRKLERYYNRGGYPRLHSGEVDDDRWADYIVQTVFESVLGNDIPDLFPVDQPRLLRALYLEVAKQTGQELAQNALTQTLCGQGFKTNQPTVGRYLHYLADALLIREYRRYPLAKKAAARLPVKVTLSDLGVRNAILRGAPSLWESDPGLLGPLVETLAQSVIRGPNVQVHFFRDYLESGNRKSPTMEVDFVPERVDGSVVPIEVKFRKRLDGEDFDGLVEFRKRYGCKAAVLVTRDHHAWDRDKQVLLLPLEAFLAAF
jgi:predicted AAA+ superfamily ATPase